MADHRRWNHDRVIGIGILISLLMVSLSGCKFPGAADPHNVTNSVLEITEINEGKVLQSDLLVGGRNTDDIISVAFKSSILTIGTDENWDNTDVGGTSPLDNITLSTYHVRYLRSDGGPVPTEFTMGIHILIPVVSEKTIEIVIVRGFAKSHSPLKELWDSGQLTVTASITFYGEDGYGNDVVITGALPICFGNYPDE